MKKLYVFLVGLLCGATFAQAQCTITLTANPNSPVCAGNPVYLYATGANNYVWTPGGLTGNSVTVYPTVTTTFVVTGTDLSSNTCSAFVMVYVNQTPTVTVPANITVCNNSTIPTTNFTSTPSGASFTWTCSNITIGLAASGSGNIPSFSAHNTTLAPITATITVTPTLAGCVGTPMSYTITVNPRPTVTVPANIVVCNGATVPASNFVSNPTGATLTWTCSNDSIGITHSGIGNVPSFIATNNSSNPIITVITVIPTLNGCSGISSSYTITVYPQDNATFTYTPSNICQGGTDITPSIASGSTGVFSATPAGLIFLNTTTGQIDVSASNANTYTITFATNGLCPSQSTKVITIVPGAPVTVTLPSNIWACNGTVIPSTVFSSTPPGASYTWTSSNPSIAMPASGSGNVPAFTATNTSSNIQTATITVTPTLSGYCSTTSTYTINVYAPATVFNPPNATYCIGSSVPAYTFSSEPLFASFVWTNSNPAIGLTAPSGSGNLPAFTAANSGSSPITATISVTPTVNGCVGIPSSYTITVNPVQTVTATIAPSPACAGQTINLSASPSGGTYLWMGPSGFTSTQQNPTITPPTWTSGTFIQELLVLQKLMVQYH